MAVSFIWPAGLPQKPLRDGYGEDSGLKILQSKPDKGPAKRRFAGSRSDVLLVSYVFTAAQVDIFDDFVENALRGVRRFGWPHPRKLTQVEARIIPAEDGKLYALTNLGGQNYHIALQLEILP